jgi:hypothetical protein
LGLLRETQDHGIYSNMTLSDLGVAQGKGRQDSAKVSHKFEGPADRYPDKTEENIGAGEPLLLISVLRE